MVQAGNSSRNGLKRGLAATPVAATPVAATPVAATLAMAMLVAISLAVAGCASGSDDQAKVVEVTVPLPPSAPRTTGVDSPATREHKQLVAYFGGEYRAAATERYLDEVLAKLAAASDTPAQVYRVTILNSPIVNAFALPSGNIYVTRGLLALANDTSEVAAVMAHEIAHVTERHAARRAELEKRSAVISQAADVIDNRDQSRTFKSYAQLTLASFSRQQEIDADEIGVHVIARGPATTLSRRRDSSSRSAAPRTCASRCTRARPRNPT